MNRRMFQIVICLLGLLPLVNGLLGLVLGTRVIDKADYPVDLDSQFRYLSGVYMAVGVLIYWIVPRIEKEKRLIRIILLLVFVGGVGRLTSLLTRGTPQLPMLIGVGFELMSPLLILWHNTIAETSPRPSRERDELALAR